MYKQLSNRIMVPVSWYNVSALKFQSQTCAPQESLELRTCLAYPSDKRIYLKDYAITNDIFSVYPSVKREVQNLFTDRYLRLGVINKLFGNTDSPMPLPAFRIIVRLGRNELTEEQTILALRAVATK